MKQIGKSSGNNEWYTPARYMASVRAALGGIDLDPCSCEIAQQTVKASTWYDERQDGLKQPFKGRVFMNPPYQRKVIDAFISKLACAYTSGEVDAFITLTNDCIDTAWAHDLLRIADAVCFVRGRIRFDTPAGVGKYAPLRGQMFCFGAHGGGLDRFIRAFNEHGAILVAPSLADDMRVSLPLFP